MKKRIVRNEGYETKILFLDLSGEEVSPGDTIVIPKKLESGYPDISVNMDAPEDKRFHIDLGDVELLDPKSADKFSERLKVASDMIQLIQEALKEEKNK